MSKVSPNQTISIPKPDLSHSSVTPAAPKTPADEGIEFFQSATIGDKPIQVYELRLDADGGPNKDASVEWPVYSPIFQGLTNLYN